MDWTEGWVAMGATPSPERTLFGREWVICYFRYLGDEMILDGRATGTMEEGADRRAIKKFKKKRFYTVNVSVFEARNREGFYEMTTISGDINFFSTNVDLSG